MGDPSHNLDLVAVFHAEGHAAEMEAIGIKAILDAAEIPAVLEGTSTIPSLPFEVQVPRERLDEAQRVIEEAKQAGPAAAEAASEQLENEG